MEVRYHQKQEEEIQLKLTQTENQLQRHRQFYEEKQKLSDKMIADL